MTSACGDHKKDESRAQTLDTVYSIGTSYIHQCCLEFELVLHRNGIKINSGEVASGVALVTKGQNVEKHMGHTSCRKCLKYVTYIKVPILINRRVSGVLI